MWTRRGRRENSERPSFIVVKKPKRELFTRPYLSSKEESPAVLQKLPDARHGSGNSSPQVQESRRTAGVTACTSLSCTKTWYSKETSSRRLRVRKRRAVRCLLFRLLKHRLQPPAARSNRVAAHLQCVTITYTPICSQQL
jgi:hypothetical protein